MNDNNKKWIELYSESEKQLEDELDKVKRQLAELGENGDPIEKAKLTLEKMTTLVGLNRNNPVWDEARPLLDFFLENDLLEEAVQTCDMLYQAHKEESTTALIHGVWLSVSFPIDPALTMSLLSAMIDEMPLDSDGAALAAATAHYVAGIRANETEYENMNFFTTNLLAKVAEGHSQVASQEAMNLWMIKLDLKDPAVFLPRLGAVLNVVVPESDWWFDREKLRARFPQEWVPLYYFQL